MRRTDASTKAESQAIRPTETDSKRIMNTIRTGMLVLEPQTAEHAAEVFPVLSDPAIYEFENSPPESEAWLERRFTQLESRVSPDGKEQWLNWVIRLPSGLLAGYVQATITSGGTAHIAYELGSKYWRQGIGSTAVRAMLKEITANYGVHAFAATLKTANYRSHALLRSLGFGPTPSSQQFALDCEPDEIVMYRTSEMNEMQVKHNPEQNLYPG